MTQASDTLTHDQDPPHRPGLSELGGGAKEDHPIRKPNPITMVCAADINQGAKQLEAIGRVIPLARVFVRFVTGAPAVFGVQALGTEVDASSFTLTDNGDGDTTVAWKTGAGAGVGALASAVGVGVFQNDDTEIDRIRATLITTGGGDPAAHVKTKLGSTGTDANFILEIF